MNESHPHPPSFQADDEILFEGITPTRGRPQNSANRNHQHQNPLNGMNEMVAGVAHQNQFNPPTTSANQQQQQQRREVDQRRVDEVLARAVQGQMNTNPQFMNGQIPPEMAAFHRPNNGVPLHPNGMPVHINGVPVHPNGMSVHPVMMSSHQVQQNGMPNGLPVQQVTPIVPVQQNQGHRPVQQVRFPQMNQPQMPMQQMVPPQNFHPNQNQIRQGHPQQSPQTLRFPTAATLNVHQQRPFVNGPVRTFQSTLRENHGAAVPVLRIPAAQRQPTNNGSNAASERPAQPQNNRDDGLTLESQDFVKFSPCKKPFPPKEQGNKAVQLRGVFTKPYKDHEDFFAMGWEVRVIL